MEEFKMKEDPLEILNIEAYDLKSLSQPITINNWKARSKRSSQRHLLEETKKKPQINLI